MDKENLKREVVSLWSFAMCGGTGSMDMFGSSLPNFYLQDKATEAKDRILKMIDEF